MFKDKQLLQDFNLETVLKPGPTKTHDQVTHLGSLKVSRCLKVDTYSTAPPLVGKEQNHLYQFLY